MFHDQIVFVGFFGMQNKKKGFEFGIDEHKL